jgi:hypothetical protein
MAINKELKASQLKGYCCRMDSGPKNKYIRGHKKRVRRLLKQITNREVREVLSEKE